MRIQYPRIQLDGAMGKYKKERLIMIYDTASAEDKMRIGITFRLFQRHIQVN